MAAKRRGGRRGRRAREVRQPVLGVVSLGCAKNTVDTERVLGMMAERGWAVSADPEWADVVIVNTCAFIAPAREETEEVLRELARSKPVVAIGCYPRRRREGSSPATYRLPSFPEVAAFVSFEDYDRLPNICARLARPVARGEHEACSFAESPRLRIGSPASAYLKIAEGCANRCRYCAIPAIRGPLRSTPVEKLREEARGLVELGAREICLVAQDTGLYGSDLYGEPRLGELLRELCRLDGAEWLRLLYIHPLHLTDDIIDVLAAEPKMCRYLDLPAQHASDRVLEAMGRGYDRAFLERLIERLRRRVEGIALRTSIIVGFPGETDEDFARLCSFIRDVRFDHLGAFEYSPEEGTPAAGLPDRPPPGLVAARRDELMCEQQRIAFEVLEARLGGVEAALLEFAEPQGRFLARTGRESPEVDGRVLVRAGGAHELGEIVQVTVTGRTGYDLTAEEEVALQY